MNVPAVSIILPTLNGAQYIRQSIDSCLQQTFSDLELIVVDGGSTDHTLAIVAGYSDPRLRLVHQPGSVGRLPGALNIGFKEAKGEFLTWTCDDNWYTPSAIETLWRFLVDHPDTDMVYTDFWRVDKAGRILSRFPAGPIEKLVECNQVGLCLLYRRKVYELVGEYDPHFFMAEDFEYWLRVSRCCKTAFLSEPLYYYRVHEHSLTDRTGGIEATQRKVEEALTKWVGPNPHRFPSRYARSIAAVYLNRAFEAHRAGQWRNRRRFLFQTLRYDPRHLGNRGVRSLLVRALARFLLGQDNQA